jgi:hypothetical protein
MFLFYISIPKIIVIGQHKMNNNNNLFFGLLIIALCIVSLVNGQGGGNKKTTTAAATTTPAPTTTAAPTTVGPTTPPATYPSGTSFSLFSDTTQEQDQTLGTEWGVRFQVNQPVLATKLRYYNAIWNQARAVGSLWNTSNNEYLVYGLQFPVPPPFNVGGYLEVDIPTPIVLYPGIVYVTSYSGVEWSAKAITRPLLNAVISGPLSAPANSNGGNGVFAPAGSLPTGSMGGEHRYADVVVTTI